MKIILFPKLTAEANSPKSKDSLPGRPCFQSVLKFWTFYACFPCMSTEHVGLIEKKIASRHLSKGLYFDPRPAGSLECRPSTITRGLLMNARYRPCFVLSKICHL